jgi:Reverse transcriptase (RNA-dependent DNA polymerase)
MSKHNTCFQIGSLCREPPTPPRQLSSQCMMQFTDQTQVFHYNTQRSGWSETHPVDCSVPQRSVLGPKEFIVYADELAELIDGYQLGHKLYADDTQLVKNTRTTDITSTIQTQQQCIEAIHKWCASRRLQLNPSKTEVVWFGTKARLIWHQGQPEKDGKL